MDLAVRLDYNNNTMQVDQVAKVDPLAFLEKAEAGAPAELQPSWTKIRTAYEKK